MRRNFEQEIRKLDQDKSAQLEESMATAAALEVEAKKVSEDLESEKRLRQEELDQVTREHGTIIKELLEKVLTSFKS
jgi:hypothetical protein